MGYKLTKKDVVHTWATWYVGYQGAWNYERLLGLGFCHALSKALAKLYNGSEEELKDSLRRNSSLFACEPCHGAALVGLTLAMEEEKANGAELTGDSINSVKTALMGPMSGIGDSLIQGVVVPLILAFFIDFASNGNIAIPIAYSAVMFIVMTALSYGFFTFGYSKGKDAILAMLSSGAINKLMIGAGIMGCTVLGALVAKHVGMSCGIQIAQGAGEPFSLQTGLFDVILPKCLPLGMTMFVYWLIVKKNLSSTKTMLIIAVIGIVGALTGILA